jgi:4-amino-4-deoxychorismate lyase
MNDRAMSQWFSAGQPIDSIAADDRAAQYGDGLFETIAIRDGAARFLDAHVVRLQTGCARLGLTSPTAGSLCAELQAALAHSRPRFATAKLVLSAGRGPRGYQRAPGLATVLRIGVFESSPLPAATYRNGVELRLCATRLAVQPQLAGLKTLNRLEQVLARAEWDDPDIFEGLMLDTAGRLICGTMSNVFIATESGLVTPAITRCGVSGIMRSEVIRLLQSAGIDCAVRDVAADELPGADELFLTNSQFGAVPVRRYASRDYAIGALCRQAQALLGANGVPECQP